MRTHFTHPYLVSPEHKISVDLVGLGGTGSQVLNNLARMNEALLGLGHPGLHVRAWDPDDVSMANMGRQLFSHADLGMNKAHVLVTRVNRFFGLDWQSFPELFKTNQTSNITITCVDTAKARLFIGEQFKKKKVNNLDRSHPTDRFLYWLDIGNLQKTGQVVLGTLINIKQPRNTEENVTGNLKTVVQKFPQLKHIKEEYQGPSCSLAEALEKQDLFINSALAQFGVALLWKLIREGRIRHHGCFLNMDSMSVTAIKVK